MATISIHISKQIMNSIVVRAAPLSSSSSLSASSIANSTAWQTNLIQGNIGILETTLSHFWKWIWNKNTKVEIKNPTLICQTYIFPLHFCTLFKKHYQGPLHVYVEKVSAIWKDVASHPLVLNDSMKSELDLVEGNHCS